VPSSTAARVLNGRRPVRLASLEKKARVWPRRQVCADAAALKASIAKLDELDPRAAGKAGIQAVLGRCPQVASFGSTGG
jgi:hypothetical protein